MSLLRTCLPAVAAAAALPAQVGLHESRGPLAGAAVAVALDGVVVGGTDATARVHRNGFASGPLQAVPAGSALPNLGAILAAYPALAGLDVDDVSLGRDDVLFDELGNSEVPPSSWSVVSFSLRTGAAPAGQPGSRIAEEALLGPIGGSVFSWIQDGAWLPPELVGPLERSHSRQELGIGPTAEVDSLDLPLVLGADQGTLASFDSGFVALDPPPYSIYFTVSHATRHLIPAAWWGGSAPTALRSGASILVTSRTAVGGSWTQPAVWKHFFELGLAQDDDIDGLAIDTVRQRILFSCVGHAHADQFLVLDYGTDGGAQPVPAKAPSGTPVSDVVGAAGNDDVDAICTLDPQIGTVGAPPPAGDDFGNSCGTPRPGLLGVPSVHASAFRRFSGGQRLFDTWLVGWPPATGITPGVAALFATIGNGSTLIPLGLQLRDPASPVPGDPVHDAIVIPNNLALSGQRLTFRWVAVDAAFSELAEAWPVQVYL